MDGWEMALAGMREQAGVLLAIGAGGIATHKLGIVESQRQLELRLEDMQRAITAFEAHRDALYQYLSSNVAVRSC